MLSYSVNNVINSALITVDFASKVCKDTEALNQCGKLFTTAVDGANYCYNMHTLKELRGTLKTVNEFVVARNLFGKIQKLLSGEISGTQVDPRTGEWAKPNARIWLDSSVSIPNVLAIGSQMSLGISDGCATLGWLDSMSIIKLADISKELGNFPVIGVLNTIALGNVKQSFAILGCFLDIADVARASLSSGFTFSLACRVVGDIAKIGGMLLISGAHPALIIIKFVANGTASTCFLIAFVIRTYKLRV